MTSNLERLRREVQKVVYDRDYETGEMHLDIPGIMLFLVASICWLALIFMLVAGAISLVLYVNWLGRAIIVAVLYGFYKVARWLLKVEKP